MTQTMPTNPEAVISCTLMGWAYHWSSHLHHRHSCLLHRLNRANPFGSSQRVSKDADCADCFPTPPLQHLVHPTHTEIAVRGGDRWETRRVGKSGVRTCKYPGR